MLNLNLLPVSQRKNLDYEINRRVVQFFGIWLSIIGVSFGIGLMPAYFFVSLLESEVERSLRVEESVAKAYGIGEIEDRIRAVNDRLGLILLREEKKRDPSPFITEVFSRTPAGVSLARVTTSDSLSKAAASGKAQTRSALLQFVSSLRSSSRVKSVSSPVANIIKEEDIEFSLEIETAL